MKNAINIKIKKDGLITNKNIINPHFSNKISEIKIRQHSISPNESELILELAKDEYIVNFDQRYLNNGNTLLTFTTGTVDAKWIKKYCEDKEREKRNNCNNRGCDGNHDNNSNNGNQNQNQNDNHNNNNFSESRGINVNFLNGNSDVDCFSDISCDDSDSGSRGGQSGKKWNPRPQIGNNDGGNGDNGEYEDDDDTDDDEENDDDQEAEDNDQNNNRDNNKGKGGKGSNNLSVENRLNNHEKQITLLTHKLDAIIKTLNDLNKLKTRK